jgi:hypothetical protein
MCQSVREQKYPLSRKKIQRVAIRLHNENAKLSESLLADQGSALCIRVSTIAVQMRQISAQQELIFNQAGVTGKIPSHDRPVLFRALLFPSAKAHD